MSKSNCEEIIGILWLILSLILIDKHYIILGIIAVCLGTFALLCSLIYAFQYNRIFREAFNKALQRINSEKEG